MSESSVVGEVERTARPCGQAAGVLLLDGEGVLSAGGS